MIKLNLTYIPIGIIILATVYFSAYYYSNNQNDIRTFEFKNPETGATSTSKILQVADNVSAVYSGEMTPEMMKMVEDFAKEVSTNTKKVANTTAKNTPEFTTQKLIEISGSVLVPNGWFFRHEMKQGVESYYVSREEVKTDSDTFKTGLTLNTFSSNALGGKKASEVGETHISTLAKKYSAQVESKNVGDFEYYSTIYLIKDPDYDYHLALRAIANVKTNTLYIMVFESPEDLWEKDWNNFGKTILDNLILK